MAVEHVNTKTVVDAPSDPVSETVLADAREEPPFKYDGIPEEKAWFISHIFFTWMRPLFRRARYQTRRGTALQHEDLLPLPRIDYGEPIWSSFERSWESAAPHGASDNSEAGEDYADDADGNKNKTSRIRKALFGVMGRRFVMAGFIKMFNTALQFSFPLLLNQILKFIEATQAGAYSGEDPWYVQYRGYWLSTVLFFFMVSKAITENAYFFAVYRSGKFGRYR
jgi:hypothetical protein